MNYKYNGWYYRSGYDKSPSWSGVEFLHNFLVSNKGSGPFGKEVGMNQIKEGDIVQLSFDGNRFAHSLFIVKILEGKKDLNNILIATHTDDSLDRRVSSYHFAKIRFIKIDGVRE